MAKTELDNKTKTEINDHSSLKGTLASVFLMGFFFVFAWLGVYYLYLNRF
ncbi:hypothetical protein [Bacillus methanolicus]|uniref:Cytochrome c oxidase subunit 2A n=1 Tax=Bacillus methanolicus (strain MGA3 / ATCC 53907) TaxID=796606 RepID=I3E9R8_BACMM|nr:hypothetical protein [Bacillus methanolicus]AIE60486.1 hypothetical protein BMMGA3_10450 [Bacillus methanolicus MGA3]EIJ83239.1 hypothetical protein MGA3_08455 [Bacillus methanolicus MGA3]UQD52497.1 cytochrome c oxidase subunit 2A [Bacillus methanolicus]